MDDPWDEAIVVRHVDALYRFGDVQIVSTWPRRGRGSVMVNVSVATTGVGAKTIVPKVRINLLSNSGRSGLFRNHPRRDELNGMWSAVISDLLEWYDRDLSETTNPDPATRREAPPWFLYPIWPAEGATGLVGSHESLKTYAAVAAALSVTTGEGYFGGNVRLSGEPRKVLYLDWEAGPESFADRMAALMNGAEIPPEPVLTHVEMRDSLIDAVPMLVERIQVGSYEAVVIDSMSASIGSGGLIADDSVNAFWDAARALAVPALVLAHKSGKATRTQEASFFGSVMSAARVRMAWNVEMEEAKAGAETYRVLWQCFKANNSNLKGSRLAWEWQFENEGENDEQRVEAVSIDSINPDSVAVKEPDDGGSGRGRGRGPGVTHLAIVHALENQGGPMTKQALVKAVGKSTNTVAKTLARMVDSGVLVQVDSGIYALIGSQARMNDLPDPL